MENKKQKIEKDGVKLLPPKMFRRQDRTKKHGGIKYTNKGVTVGSNRFIVGLGKVWNPQAIHNPKRKKFKGWQKENRRYRKTA